jgi:hypothetical protein
MIIYITTLIVLLIGYGILARLGFIDVDEDAIWHVCLIVVWPFCAIVTLSAIAVVIGYYSICFLIYILTGKKTWCDTVIASIHTYFKELI